MKFRKKPIIIDACKTDIEMKIETLEGTMTASAGDWIITGINGEKYPCKSDIFEKTYELVEEKTIHNPVTGNDYPIAKRTVERSRRLDGAWRKKRSDTGKKRKMYNKCR